MPVYASGPSSSSKSTSSTCRSRRGRNGPGLRTPLPTIGICVPLAVASEPNTNAATAASAPATSNRTGNRVMRLPFAPIERGVISRLLPLRYALISSLRSSVAPPRKRIRTREGPPVRVALLEVVPPTLSSSVSGDIIADPEPERYCAGSISTYRRACRAPGQLCCKPDGRLTRCRATRERRRQRRNTRATRQR